MKVVTKLFGQVEVDERKILTFDTGIIGFPDFKRFMLIHEDGKAEKNILWLQSIDSTEFALPVLNPLLLLDEYNPIIEDELLAPLGEMTNDNTFVLVTVTVPRELTEMSVNLKAPIIINTETRKASQLIIENETYNIKYPVYHILKALNKKDGEE